MEDTKKRVEDLPISLKQLELLHHLKVDFLLVLSGRAFPRFASYGEVSSLLLRPPS